MKWGGEIPITQSPHYRCLQSYSWYPTLCTVCPDSPLLLLIPHSPCLYSVPAIVRSQLLPLLGPNSTWDGLVLLQCCLSVPACLKTKKQMAVPMHLFSAEASCNFVSAPFQVGFQAEWTLIPSWATSDSESCTSSLLVFLVTSLSLLKFREKSHLWT